MSNRVDYDRIAASLAHALEQIITPGSSLVPSIAAARDAAGSLKLSEFKWLDLELRGYADRRASGMSILGEVLGVDGTNDLAERVARCRALEGVVQLEFNPGRPAEKLPYPYFATQSVAEIEYWLARGQGDFRLTVTWDHLPEIFRRMFESFGVQPHALGAGLPVYFARQAFLGMHQAIQAEVAGFISTAQLMCWTSRPVSAGASVASASVSASAALVVVRKVGSLQVRFSRGLEEGRQQYEQEEIVSLEDLATEEIVLVKLDGSEHKAMASVQGNKMIVFDTTFPVQGGDTIRHTLPSGLVQLFEVIDPGFIAGPGRMKELSHYEIKVRNRGAPRRDPAPPVVHHNVSHNYHNSGIANVLGPDGVASGNTNSIQNTEQTLHLGDPRIATELAEIRKALSSEDDDDAAIEVGHIVSAQKALKASDESGFRAAMKRLGTKTRDVAQGLALAWMTQEGRKLLGLPPG